MVIFSCIVRYAVEHLRPVCLCVISIVEMTLQNMEVFNVETTRIFSPLDIYLQIAVKWLTPRAINLKYNLLAT